MATAISSRRSCGTLWSVGSAGGRASDESCTASGCARATHGSHAARLASLAPSQSLPRVTSACTVYGLLPGGQPVRKNGDARRGGDLGAHREHPIHHHRKPRMQRGLAVPRERDPVGRRRRTGQRPAEAVGDFVGRRPARAARFRCVEAAMTVGQLNEQSFEPGGSRLMPRLVPRRRDRTGPYTLVSHSGVASAIVEGTLGPTLT